MPGRVPPTRKDCAMSRSSCQESAGIYPRQRLKSNDFSTTTTLQRTDVIAALEQKLKNKEEQLISELERVTLITKKDAIASLYSKFNFNDCIS